MLIGDVSVDPPLVLAPMAGVTDRDFRLMVRRIGGVGMVGMEFLSADGLADDDRRWTRLTHFVEAERPISIQIYGGDPETMGRAAEIVEALRPDVCDINMGCPANKILKGCRGAALMGDLDLAERIVARVRRALTLPLTVKFRYGIDGSEPTFLELARRCEANGVDAVVLHPRTAKEKFTGQARWDAISRLKETVAIPVIGNGDVETAEDAVRMLRETGCDGVMIGRAATKNPWIFRQAADRLEGRPARPVAVEELYRFVVDHFQRVIAREDETFALFKLKKFTGLYSRALPDGVLLRREIQRHRTAEELFTTVEAFFAARAETAA